jgi:hypothetical protein
VCFQAWSDPKQKAKWFSGPPGWKQLKLSNDFRAGGGDVSIGEAGAFLDGVDNPKQRREGTEQLLEAIGRSLKS